MAFHDHDMAFESFGDQESREVQQRLMLEATGKPPLSVSVAAAGGSGAPTWLSDAILRREDSVHLRSRNDDVPSIVAAGGSSDRNREESECEGSWEWEGARHKGEIAAHPLYEQLLSAHVACLRIATPVDQLPRIDAQLAQSQRVVAKYSALGNSAVDEKELDQFMVSLASYFFLHF